MTCLLAGKSTGAIVGGIVGAVVGIVLITLLITFLVYRVHKRRRQQRDAASRIGKAKTSNTSATGLFDSAQHSQGSGRLAAKG